MNSLLGVISLFAFLLILSLLVFVHELGHFLLAKAFGVHVEEFGIGFPPRLIGAVRDAQGKWHWFTGFNAPKPAELGGPSTIYSLNSIPLGGFVRPAGEHNDSLPNGFASAPKHARLAILAAGPVFNLLFSFLIFVIGFRLGWPDQIYIANVVADTPAQATGLQAEDIILRAAGQEVHYPQQLRYITFDHLGQPMVLEVERQGQVVELTIIPRLEWPAGQGPIGIEMGQSLIKSYAWPQAVGRAGQEILFEIQELVQLPGRIMREEIPPEAARPCGPVCMNDLTRAAVATAQETNQWFPLIQFIGLISIALGTTNLLPLPALDGGRILFVLLETVRGRRFNPLREGAVHMVGMVLLLVLMVFITYQDIVNPIVPR